MIRRPGLAASFGQFVMALRMVRGNSALIATLAEAGTGSGTGNAGTGNVAKGNSAIQPGSSGGGGEVPLGSVSDSGTSGASGTPGAPRLGADRSTVRRNHPDDR